MSGLPQKNGERKTWKSDYGGRDRSLDGMRCVVHRGLFLTTAKPLDLNPMQIAWPVMVVVYGTSGTALGVASLPNFVPIRSRNDVYTNIPGERRAYSLSVL